MSDIAPFAGPAVQLAGATLGFLGGQQQQAATAAQNQFSNMMAQQQLNAQMSQFQQGQNDWWANFGLAESEFSWQQQMAANGVQLRVNDAKAAGISPLVALGMQPTNVSPILVGGGPSGDVSGGGAPGLPGVNPFAEAGRGLEGMGQDISRAAMAAQTAKTRADALVQVETMRNNSAVAQSEAERNMAEAALARRRADLIGSPHMPSADPVGSVQVMPAKVISSDAPGGGGEAGGTPAYKWVRDSEGGLRMQPSLGTSAGATGEDLGWSLNYRLPQMWGKNRPPDAMLPAGASRWELGWNGTWYPRGGSSAGFDSRWSYPDSSVTAP